MSSQPKLEANRINAKRSTGPKTPSGKARSSMNARKHGLTGKSIVIGDEDPEEFEALRESLEHDWQPSTALESELVDRLAGLLWRLRRVPAIEAAIVKSHLQSAYDEVYSQVERERLSELDEEAHRRCQLSFVTDPEKPVAISRPIYETKLAEIRRDLRDNKSDHEASISEEADERFENSHERELVSLMRATGSLIDRLSRYEAALMGAMNKTLQQLWLVRNTKDRSQTITPETAVRSVRLVSDKSDPTRS